MIALLSSSVVFLTIFIASATGLPTAQQQPVSFSLKIDFP
jgi:hypothetical protein